jgi:putative hydrolase of the HAD superfamily
VPGFTTVLFDLFDTLVRFDRQRLPAVRIDGREVRSSVGRLHPVVAEAFPEVGLEALHEAFLWSYLEAERRREVGHREVPAPERIGFCYARLGIDRAAVPPGLTERILGVHMRCLAEVAEPMPGRKELLEWLAGRYRLGLVSNFDYSPTVELILERGGLRDRFETVVVSDAVGWRKPSAAIFREACGCLGVGSPECLFVGDLPAVDVAGAKGMGMAAAWLNPRGEPFPQGLPRPDYTLSGLADLRPILEGHTPRKP